MCDLAFNSICSASIGIGQAYIVFSWEHILLLEHAVRAVTDVPGWCATDCIANMESTLWLVCSSVTSLAAYMEDYAKQHCCEVTFAVDS